MTETDAESLARKYGWEFGGDGAGFIFHQPTWGSWKAALSWSGAEEGTAPLGTRRAIYESRLACVEGEGLLQLSPFWQFQTESNAVEGLAACRPEEVLALADFVALDKIHVQHLSEYVRVVQPDATLRARLGLEAAVNGRKCYPGG
jgi:hypothetical protein